LPAAELWPPEHLAWWLLAVGLGLLVLVALWYVFVFRSTRPERPHQPPIIGSGERGGFEARVAELHRRYEARDLDLRGLHLELARTMREYASARLGRDVSSWTASELAEATRSDVALGDLLLEWEEPSFARRSDAEADRAVAGAREVIARW